MGCSPSKAKRCKVNTFMETHVHAQTTNLPIIVIECAYGYKEQMQYVGEFEDFVEQKPADNENTKRNMRNCMEQLMNPLADLKYGILK